MRFFSFSEIHGLCKRLIVLVSSVFLIISASNFIFADTNDSIIVAQNDNKEEPKKDKTENGKTEESKPEIKKPPTTAGKLPIPSVKEILSTEKVLPGATVSQPPVDTQTVSETPAAGDSVGVASLTGKTPTVPGASVPKIKKEERPKKPGKLKEEYSIFNVPTNNLRTMKPVIDDQFFLRGIVYGDERGIIHICQADDDDNLVETWKSPQLNAEIRGIFVDDLDGKGEAKIIAFTQNGNFFIFGYDTHNMIYRSPDGTYQKINCMVIDNLDNDPQKEILFVAIKPGSQTGNLIQFDTQTLFEEWTSSEAYMATDMIIGNVDADSDKEIIMNTGEVLTTRFKSLKWKCETNGGFGDRLQLIDIDNDNILELVAEYGDLYVRVIDVDQRLEKW